MVICGRIAQRDDGWGLWPVEVGEHRPWVDLCERLLPAHLLGSAIADVSTALQEQHDVGMGGCQFSVMRDEDYAVPGVCEFPTAAQRDLLIAYVPACGRFIQRQQLTILDIGAG